MIWPVRKKNPNPVTFATTCWEGDYRILLQEDYLKRQIEGHLYPFQEKVLIINNVKNYDEVTALAEKRVEDGSLTKIFIAKEKEEEVLSFFKLKREELRLGADKEKYPDLDDSWVYYNALGPMAAIYFLETEYLLYQTGDVMVSPPCNWIDKAIWLLKKNPKIKIANLTWNHQIKEVKQESYRKKRGFFLAKQGFSDQMFLGKKEDLRAPILSEIREDAAHFPRGDVFEKRIFSYMKNHGWERITYKKGSYIHPCH